jgi:hypothetical protein
VLACRNSFPEMPGERHGRMNERIGSRRYSLMDSQEWLPYLRRRPRPGLGIFDETGSDGILFDIPCDSIVFGPISYPMVEQFVLPEMSARSPEYLIGLASSNALEAIGDPRERKGRLDENVAVIGHDGERAEHGLMQLMFAP